MKKLFVSFTFMLFSQFLWGNMASPYRDGTHSGTIFTSKQIDIKKEKLELNITSDLQTGKYKVQYYIYTDKEIKNLPLLFYAINYLDSFQVKVDSKAVLPSPIPEKEIQNSSSSIRSILDTLFTEDYYLEFDGNYLQYSDLKYFEVQLDSGEHVITVEYTSTPGTDRTEWVKIYEYHYSLYPARFWKSFGQLDISIKANFSQFEYKDNLGMPFQFNDSIRTYKFFKIPVDKIQITAVPKINQPAHFLIWLSPLGIAFITLVVIALTHVFLIWLFHKNNPSKKARRIVIVGSIFAPLLAYIVYMYSFSAIDEVIGEHASRYHGYYFLMIVYYPIVLLIYCPIMVGISYIIKKTIKTADDYKK
jgi:hypothetical protein